MSTMIMLGAALPFAEAMACSVTTAMSAMSLSPNTGDTLSPTTVSGISPPTAQKWLSVLERAYIIRLVQPYFGNLTSRVRKASKIYFLDTGLASYLMGYRDPVTLQQSPHLGPLFETLVYSDFIKRTANQGEIPEHFYLQTKSKIGVDFLVQKNRKLDLFEVKFSQTFQNRLTQQLVLTRHALKNVNSLNLIMPTDNDFETKVAEFDIHVKNWSRMS